MTAAERKIKNKGEPTEMSKTMIKKTPEPRNGVESFLDGVGADAEELAERIVNRKARCYGTAA